MKHEEIPQINTMVYGIRLNDNYICHGKLITISTENNRLQFRVSTEKDTIVNCDFVASTSLKLTEHVIVYFTKIHQKVCEAIRQYTSKYPILKSPEPPFE